MTDLKVGVAAFIGAVAPATNLFLGEYEPVFRILALLGQVVVAAVTSAYIFSKWRAVRKNRKDDENP